MAEFYQTVHTLARVDSLQWTKGHFIVPTLDQYRSYASKAQQQLINQFLSSRFSGRSWDRIWFDDEDETSVKSQIVSVT